MSESMSDDAVGAVPDEADDFTSDAITAGDIGEGFAPHVRASVAGVELDGETVLLDDESGAMHTLNPTATVVWSCFDGSGTVAEIAADVADAYGADPTTVTSDVLELARALGRQGLLVGVAPDPDPEGEHAGHHHDHGHHDHDLPHHDLPHHEGDAGA